MQGDLSVDSKKSLLRCMNWGYGPLIFLFLAQNFFLFNAAAKEVQLLRSSDSSMRIQGLSLDEIYSTEDDTVKVRGTFLNADATLIEGKGSTPLPVDEKGGFSVSFKIDAKTSDQELIAIDGVGKIERETFTLKVVATKTAGSEMKPLAWRERLVLVPGLSFSSIQQSEEGVADYSSVALTAKGSVNYALDPPLWDAGFSFYLTALQLTRSRDVDVRYFGLNLRLGYIVPEAEEPWKVTIYGGWYYATMFVNPGLDSNGKPFRTFGFTNVSGPQIYPTIKYTLSTTDALSSYFKFSPVGSSLSLLSLSNREIAFGFAFTRVLEDGHTGSIVLDFSQLNLTFAGILSSVSTLSLGASYSL